MKRNKVRYQNFDKILFVPKRRNFFDRNNKKIFFIILTICFIYIANLYKLYILEATFPFPKNKINFTPDTNVYCEDSSYYMAADYDENYYYTLKTDFIGYVTNNNWFTARNVKLGVKIRGISNPGAKWTMGTLIIDEIPPFSTRKFNARFEHNCAQSDITWTFEIIEASYL